MIWASMKQINWKFGNICSVCKAVYEESLFLFALRTEGTCILYSLSSLRNIYRDIQFFKFELSTEVDFPN